MIPDIDINASYEELFNFYKEFTGKPYLEIIYRNWLLENPVNITNYKNIEVSGRYYIPLEVGDLNYDGITDYKDFSIYSQYNNDEH